MGSVATALHAYLSEETGGDSFLSLIPGQAKNLEKAKEEASSVVIGMAMGSNIDGPGLPSSEKKIAVINMSGMLMQTSYYWLGADYLCYLLAEAEKEPNIDAIVLNMNCPGGSVQASETLADCLKTLTKPVVTYVNKLCCSGGYWVAGNSDHIMVNGKTAILGSIGVMTTIVQYKNSDSAKIFELYASTSGKKNEAVRELAKGKDTAIIARLDAMDAIFMEEVQAGRGDLLDEENTLAGQDYLTADALKYGLADSMGTLQDAVNKAAELADSGITTKGKKDMALFGNSLPKDIMALVGKPVAEITDQALAAANAALGAEKVEGLELVRVADVQALQTKAKDLENANVQLTQDMSVLTDAKTKAEEELATAQAEVTRLGNQPGAKPAAVASTKPAEAISDVKENPFLTSFDVEARELHAQLNPTT